MNVKCGNEKQQRWVVLNRRVLRASTREDEEEDAQMMMMMMMRVKARIVAYGRRTWTREVII